MIQYVDLVEDTICAPITAPGYSGVAVVRISGKNSLNLTKSFCPFLKDNTESHKVYFGSFKVNENKIDQVLVTYFKEGSSFTGDEVVEISCHGSPLVVNTIVNEYLSMGCRNAERGEFSFRAFYNGKIDLVQAESIQTLITSQSGASSIESLKQLEGDLSFVFKELEEELILAISHLEATIDFVEQEIDPSDYSAITKRLKKVSEQTSWLIESYHIGKNLLKPQQVLLVGETNVGKSSLFNKLFNQEKAIVTDISGTTRDLISGETFLGSLSVEFTDSAGLRESQDKVEAIGIQKTLEKIDSAQALLLVLDATLPLNKDLLKKIPQEKCFIVFNKMDLIKDSKSFLKNIQKSFSEAGFSFDEQRCFFISALSGDGIEQLKQNLSRELGSSQKLDGDHMITQARHFNHLSSLSIYIDKSMDMLSLEESPDLISQELQYGLMEIHKLLGKKYDDQVLDKIFSEFCIGK